MKFNKKKKEEAKTIDGIGVIGYIRKISFFELNWEITS